MSSSLACELCDRPPAVVACDTCDMAGLCRACDSDVHKGAKATSHKRRMLGGNSGTSATQTQQQQQQQQPQQAQQQRSLQVDVPPAASSVAFPAPLSPPRLQAVPPRTPINLLTNRMVASSQTSRGATPLPLGAIDEYGTTHHAAPRPMHSRAPSSRRMGSDVLSQISMSAAAAAAAPAPKCDLCNWHTAAVNCASCSMNLCAAGHCDATIHRSSKLYMHIRVPLAQPQPVSLLAHLAMRSGRGESMEHGSHLQLFHPSDPIVPSARSPSPSLALAALTRPLSMDFSSASSSSFARSCDECRVKPAASHCSSCQRYSCVQCDHTAHRSAATKDHARTAYPSFSGMRPETAPPIEGEGGATTSSLAPQPHRPSTTPVPASSLSVDNNKHHLLSPALAALMQQQTGRGHSLGGTGGSGSGNRPISRQNLAQQGGFIPPPSSARPAFQLTVRPPVTPKSGGGGFPFAAASPTNRGALGGGESRPGTSMGGSRVQSPSPAPASPAPAVVCDICEDSRATVHCAECQMKLCTANACDEELHAPAKMRTHVRTPLQQPPMSFSTGALVAQASVAALRPMKSSRTVTASSLTSATVDALFRPASSARNGGGGGVGGAMPLSLSSSGLNRAATTPSLHAHARATEAPMARAVTVPTAGFSGSRPGTSSSGGGGGGQGAVAAPPPATNSFFPKQTATTASPFPVSSDAQTARTARGNRLCEICEAHPATRYCPSCPLYVCVAGGCDAQLHAPAKVSHHVRQPMPAPPCSLCEDAEGAVWCFDCKKHYCIADGCDAAFHQPAKTRGHRREGVRALHANDRDTDDNDNNSPALTSTEIKAAVVVPEAVLNDASPTLTSAPIAASIPQPRLKLSVTDESAATETTMSPKAAIAANTATATTATSPSNARNNNLMMPLDPANLPPLHGRQSPLPPLGGHSRSASLPAWSSGAASLGPSPLLSLALASTQAAQDAATAAATSSSSASESASKNTADATAPAAAAAAPAATTKTKTPISAATTKQKDEVPPPATSNNNTNSAATVATTTASRSRSSSSATAASAPSSTATSTAPSAQVPTPSPNSSSSAPKQKQKQKRAPVTGLRSPPLSPLLTTATPVPIPKLRLDTPSLLAAAAAAPMHPSAGKPPPPESGSDDSSGNSSASTSSSSYHAGAAEAQAQAQAQARKGVKSPGSVVRPTAEQQQQKKKKKKPQGDQEASHAQTQAQAAAALEAAAPKAPVPTNPTAAASGPPAPAPAPANLASLRDSLQSRVTQLQLDLQESVQLKSARIHSARAEAALSARRGPGRGHEQREDEEPDEVSKPTTMTGAAPQPASASSSGGVSDTPEAMAAIRVELVAARTQLQQFQSLAQSLVEQMKTQAETHQLMQQQQREAAAAAAAAAAATAAAAPPGQTAWPVPMQQPAAVAGLATSASMSSLPPRPSTTGFVPPIPLIPLSSSLSSLPAPMQRELQDLIAQTVQATLASVPSSGTATRRGGGEFAHASEFKEEEMEYDFDEEEIDRSALQQQRHYQKSASASARRRAARHRSMGDPRPSGEEVPSEDTDPDVDARSRASTPGRPPTAAAVARARGQAAAAAAASHGNLPALLRKGTPGYDDVVQRAKKQLATRTPSSVQDSKEGGATAAAQRPRAASQAGSSAHPSSEQAPEARVGSATTHLRSALKSGGGGGGSGTPGSPSLIAMPPPVIAAENDAVVFLSPTPRPSPAPSSSKSASRKVARSAADAGAPATGERPDSAVHSADTSARSHASAQFNHFFSDEDEEENGELGLADMPDQPISATTSTLIARYREEALDALRSAATSAPASLGPQGLTPLPHGGSRLPPLSASSLSSFALNPLHLEPRPQSNPAYSSLSHVPVSGVPTSRGGVGRAAIAGAGAGSPYSATPSSAAGAVSSSERRRAREVKRAQALELQLVRERALRQEEAVKHLALQESMRAMQAERDALMKRDGLSPSNQLHSKSRVEYHDEGRTAAPVVPHPLSPSSHSPKNSSSASSGGLASSSGGGGGSEVALAAQSFDSLSPKAQRSFFASNVLLKSSFMPQQQLLQLNGDRPHRPATAAVAAAASAGAAAPSTASPPSALRHGGVTLVARSGSGGGAIPGVSIGSVYAAGSSSSSSSKLQLPTGHPGKAILRNPSPQPGPASQLKGSGAALPVYRPPTSTGMASATGGSKVAPHAKPAVAPVWMV